VHICVLYCTNLVLQPNKQADGSLIIETNEEIDKFTKRKKREFKSRRIAWLGHLERMEEHQLNGAGRLCTAWFKSSEDVKLEKAS
jgi:hypothetical protein